MARLFCFRLFELHTARRSAATLPAFIAHSTARLDGSTLSAAQLCSTWLDSATHPCYSTLLLISAPRLIISLILGSAPCSPPRLSSSALLLGPIWLSSLALLFGSPTRLSYSLSNPALLLCSPTRFSSTLSLLLALLLCLLLILDSATPSATLSATRLCSTRLESATHLCFSSLLLISATRPSFLCYSALLLLLS
jgi:hypothetical protein